jgi:hypothetical protein
MGKQHTPIDKLVESAVESLSKASYFTKTEVRRDVLKHKNLSGFLVDVGKRYPGWKFDQAIIAHVDEVISVAVRQTDAHGIRLYECYAVGNRDRRYMRLRAMKANQLRAAIQETRVQARKLDIKVRVLEYYLDLVEKVGPNASVGDVYDKALPHILELKANDH